MSDVPLSRGKLAAAIDQTLLRIDASILEVRQGCELAAEHEFAAMCVRPCDVVEASKVLDGTGVAVATTIAFPLGYAATPVKSAETLRAIEDGADEIDMVMNIGRLLEGQDDYVGEDIAAVVARAGGRIVKVILECCYLSRSQMACACRAACEAGADFVKTSTGFGPSGATVSDVRFLRGEVGASMGVKAAGGIATLSEAVAMLGAGATRLGTSKGTSILAELACEG